MTSIQNGSAMREEEEITDLEAFHRELPYPPARADEPLRRVC